MGVGVGRGHHTLAMKMQSDKNRTPCSRTFDLWTPCPAHLVFLRELQVVVGLEELRVLGQLGDGDGGVVHHTCSSRKTPRKDPPGGRREGGGSPLAKQTRNSETATSSAKVLASFRRTPGISHKEKQSKSEGTRPELEDFCAHVCRPEADLETDQSADLELRVC